MYHQEWHGRPRRRRPHPGWYRAAWGVVAVVAVVLVWLLGVGVGDAAVTP